MQHQRFWRQREDYRALLSEAKELFPTLLKHVKASRVLLTSFTGRKCRFIARVRANKNPWRLVLPQYDYAIEFWATQFDETSHAYKVFVVVHELLHIPRGGFLSGGPSHLRLLDHDIQDFLFLRSLYGLHLEGVDDVLKGEKALLKKGPRRFPRQFIIK